MSSANSELNPRQRIALPNLYACTIADCEARIEYRETHRFEFPKPEAEAPPLPEAPLPQPRILVRWKKIPPAGKAAQSAGPNARKPKSGGSVKVKNGISGTVSGTKICPHCHVHTKEVHRHIQSGACKMLEPRKYVCSACHKEFSRKDCLGPNRHVENSVACKNNQKRAKKGKLDLGVQRRGQPMIEAATARATKPRAPAPPITPTRVPRENLDEWEYDYLCESENLYRALRWLGGGPVNFDPPEGFSGFVNPATDL
ncbi:hypothetical protein ONZ45_g6799 [Pleurotus djamor]|nr:hypothetical protein ONZ45_g6799 [Pleurotus djamor]